MTTAMNTSHSPDRDDAFRNVIYKCDYSGPFVAENAVEQLRDSRTMNELNCKLCHIFIV